MPPALHLREATAADLETVNAIYNHYVHTSDCTLQLTPSTLAERQAWFDAQGPLPVLIAEEGEATAQAPGSAAGRVVGWGALVRFNPREGYRFTLEDSIYLDATAHGRGVGRLLLTALIERARGLGAHSVIAKINAAQTPSLRLHASLGFVEVGRLPEVGFKFGRWVDVAFLQLRL